MKDKTNNHESISPVKNYNIPIILHFLVYTSPSPSPSVVPPPQGKLFCCYFSCFQYNFTVMCEFLYSAFCLFPCLWILRKIVLFCIYSSATHFLHSTLYLWDSSILMHIIQSLNLDTVDRLNWIIFCCRGLSSAYQSLTHSSF